MSFFLLSCKRTLEILVLMYFYQFLCFKVVFCIMYALNHMLILTFDSAIGCLWQDVSFLTTVLTVVRSVSVVQVWTGVIPSAGVSASQGGQGITVILTLTSAKKTLSSAVMQWFAITQRDPIDAIVKTVFNCLMRNVKVSIVIRLVVIFRR